LLSEYRYHLSRSGWLTGEGICLFIMLNPSTATQNKDDPTIRRCKGFAKLWGFAKLEVVNLFAARATEPKELKEMEDPIGQGNDETILYTAKNARQIIVAWGAHGPYQERDKEVIRLLKDYDLYSLGTTKKGNPRHPLYIRIDQKPVPFSGEFEEFI